METVRDSVKKILGNENGNLMMVITLIVMITGAIGYFMAVSDRVDTEIRVLGGTQATAYLKSDIQESLRRAMKTGNHDTCTIADSMKTMYQDFLRSDADSIFSLDLRKPDNVGYAAWIGDPNTLGKLSCFFHPNRYNGNTEFHLFKITMKRSSTPNLVNLSNYIQAEILIQAVTAGRSTNLKYLMRFRVDALTMANYGMIFGLDNPAQPLYDVAADARLTIDAKTLIEQPDRNREVALSNISNYTNVFFNQKVWLTSPNIGTDAAAVNFLRSKNLRDYFREGIVFDAFDDRSQIVPWRVSTGQYNDLFDYDLIMNSRYPLPKLSGSQISAIATSSGTITHEYGNDKDNNPIPDGINNHNQNTAGIFELMYPEAPPTPNMNKNKLWKSCTSVDTSTGVYNMLVFNNKNMDFTVDFSQSKTTVDPPVFCGMIAAKNLTIILNGEDEASETYSHFIIGKFLITGQIKVVNRGKISLVDILDLDQDTTPYTVIDDFTNLQVQYFNQKYYSGQNFTLPFFRTNSIYSLTDYTAGADRFWVPRDTRNLFTASCGIGSTYKCRINPIGSPTDSTSILTAHASNLLYEVTNVE